MCPSPIHLCYVGTVYLVQCSMCPSPIHLRYISPQMYTNVRDKKKKFALADQADKAKKLVVVGGVSEGSAEGTQHSFPEEEKLAFVDWINFQLENDADLSGIVPIEETGDGLFKSVYNGLVLW